MVEGRFVDDEAALAKSGLGMFKPANITVYAKHGSIPTADAYDFKFSGNTPLKSDSLQYPTAGRWFILMKAEKLNPGKTSAPYGLSYTMRVYNHRCANSCSGSGDCKVKQGDHNAVYAFCDCGRPFKGWDCSDLIYKQLFRIVRMALLVLSNLAFIPGIILSKKMKLWSECFVYLYTMISSCLYHCVR